MSRFTVYYNRHPCLADWNVKDNDCQCDAFLPMTSQNIAEEVCNILNEFNDEITKLRKEVVYHKEMHYKYKQETSYIKLAENNRLKNENDELKQQLNRLYNYFEDWHKDDMEASGFSEMWDTVKNSEKWE